MSSFEVAQRIDYIAEKYEFYSSIFLLVIGMISNILIITVFTNVRIFRGNKCAYYLVIESITDIGLLLAILPSDITGYFLHANPATLSVIWCKIVLMWSYGCGLHSLYTICFLAFDQFLSTNYRQSWRQLSTLKLAHHLAFFNISVVVFHGILFLIFGEIGLLGCSIYNPIAKMYFTFFYYPIFGGTLPIVVSGAFSLLAYHNVRRIVRRQIRLVRRRLDRQMTAIALARVLCILILLAPFLVLNLFELNRVYDNENYMGLAILNLLSVVIYSWLYLNYAVSYVNSFIYEIFNINGFFLDQFLFIFTYITAFSSSNETFICEKRVDLFETIM